MNRRRWLALVGAGWAGRCWLGWLGWLVAVFAVMFVFTVALAVALFPCAAHFRPGTHKIIKKIAFSSKTLTTF